MIIDRTTFSPSTYADLPAIKSVHARAFGRDIEPDLAQRLIEAKETTLDLCASIDGMIVGHCILTELKGPKMAMALAPLAVDPNWRDFKIGTELVRRLLSNAREAGWYSVFVLGDPDYYGRFGFKSELADCVDCEYQGNSFQALELVAGALKDYHGVLEYPQIFNITQAA